MNSLFRSKSLEISLHNQFKENLREFLSEEDNSDEIYKWLRARNFDLYKAETLFKQNLAARQLFGSDTITETYEMSEVLENYSFNGFLGFAKDESPVRYIALGRGDYIGFLKTISIVDIAYYGIFIIETDKKAMKKHNKMMGVENNEITYIFDITDFSLQKTAYKSVMETAWHLSHVVQDYYPEIWKRVIFINVPIYFYAAYNVIKPILKATLLEKISVVSKENSPQELLKYIDADVLPVFLGGNKLDSNGDPKCPEYIKFGGIIPQEYYDCNLPHFQMGDPEVECITIRPRSYYNYVITNKKAGSKVHLEFRSENGPVNGLIYYKKFGSNSKAPGLYDSLDASDSDCFMIIPELKLQIHLAPNNNHYFLPWTGFYIFQIGNAFSWFHSQKILLRCHVSPPTEESKKLIKKCPF